MIIAISIGVSLLMAWLLFGVFFDDLDDFTRSISYWFSSNIFLLFRGEWLEGHWAQLKLNVYVLLTVGSGFLAYQKLLEWLG